MTTGSGGGPSSDAGPEELDDASVVVVSAALVSVDVSAGALVEVASPAVVVPSGLSAAGAVHPTIAAAMARARSREERMGFIAAP
jgi:hypothetical protein